MSRIITNNVMFKKTCSYNKGARPWDVNINESEHARWQNFLKNQKQSQPTAAGELPSSSASGGNPIFFNRSKQ